MKFLELKIPPAATFLLCAAGMFATARAFPQAHFEIPAAAVIAIALFAGGSAIAVSGMRLFRQQDTTFHPMKPAEATSLVRDGIYRYTRNPMYLGLVLCLAAWAAFLENSACLPWIVVFVIYMTRFQIKPEERALAEKFGANYAEYFSTARRWL